MAERQSSNGAPDAGQRRQRLGRAERREQILSVATGVFSEAGGCAATNLDDIAAAAGISRMILYRHFESKVDLFRAVLERAGERMYRATTTESGELSDVTIPAMVRWAAAEPAAFRVLFQHAARDPEFRGDIDELRAGMATAAHPHLTTDSVDDGWMRWLAQLLTAVVVEGILAWLDTGQPDPEQAPERITAAADAVYRSARGD